ncbi:hypothetical protein C0995_015249 [Termitomyces sp. Mi166|nr:hypothetical protein C0995_015249 [Termitomyces sp. Mi166\
MSSTHLSDTELIEKLENVAGLTNDNVLSVGEISRGRILLSHARDTLAHLNSSSIAQAQVYRSTFALPEHVARLSVALAPHKQLPLEILEQIFRSGSEGLLSVKLPPILSEYRWVLGRVCSTWRRLSRSIPFWEAAITFYYDTEWFENIFYRRSHVERAWKQLRCALDILPEFAFIRVSIDDFDPGPISTSTLIPYLTHIKALKWCLCRSNREQLIEVFPRGALSPLRSLSIQLPIPDRHDTAVIAPSVDLFGESSRLQHLDFTSGCPTFLHSNIPWCQLQSFKLSNPDDSDMSLQIHTSWVQLAQRDPFRLMSSLEHLTLDMGADLFRILLPCMFPWHNLKALTIVWPNQGPDLPLIMKPLQQCTSLLTLELSYQGTDKIAFDAVSVQLPSLQNLTLVYSGFLLASMVMSIALSGTLRSLLAGSIPLQDFYTIATKCHRLADYQSRLVDGELAANITDFLTLPHLTSLDISLDDSSSFPAAIIAPLLTSLCISGPGLGYNIVEMIVDFIVRSKIQLQTLRLHHREMVSPESLRELLTAVDSCHHVEIRGILFPQQILDEVASGLLLSRSEYLCIGLSAPEIFLTVVRHCLKRQAASGCVILREICGCLPRTYETIAEDIMIDLQNLEESYSVNVEIYILHLRRRRENIFPLQYNQRVYLLK